MLCNEHNTNLPDGNSWAYVHMEYQGKYATIIAGRMCSVIPSQNRVMGSDMQNYVNVDAMLKYLLYSILE